MRRPLAVSAEIRLPDWVASLVSGRSELPQREERIALVLDLARENVRRGTGGPFGAAVFASESGRLLSAGVNRVVPLHSSSLHAEVVALALAQESAGSHTLRGAGDPECELVASCDPCAMCLGAVLWSGVSRLVCAAAREDAETAGFDEGPVYPESLDYLRRRGIEIVRGESREEARRILLEYRDRGGPIYNA